MFSEMRQCTLARAKNAAMPLVFALFGPTTLLDRHFVQYKSALHYGSDKGRTPDHHHRRARTRQKSAEISTHGAGTNYGNLRPAFLLGHGVTTLMSRSISRSVLYK